MSLDDDLKQDTDPALVGGDTDDGADRSSAAAETADTPSAADEPSSAYEVAAKTLTEMRGEPDEPEDDAEAGDDAGEAEAKTDYDAKGDEKPDAEAKDKAEDKDGSDGAKDENYLSDTEIKGLPPKARRRISDLTKKQHEQRERAEALEADLSEYQPRAEAFDKLQSIMDSNGITGELLSNSLAATAAYQSGEYADFLKMVGPLVQQARMAMGEEIDPTLADQIEAGELTEEAAKRLTKDRMEAARVRQERDRLAASEKETRETRSQETQRATLRDAADREVGRLRQNDPRYALKEPEIAKWVREHIASAGGVTSPEAATALVRQAHEVVTLRMERQNGRKPVRGAPNPSGSPSMSREPQSPMEAAQMGLEMARRRSA